LKALGRHFILECYECDSDILNDIEQIENYMNQAAEEAHATIIKSLFHPFFPHGISGVIVIAESHLTVHTWPEHRYAAVDIFTCGDEAEPEAACSFLAEAFNAQQTTIMELKRGQNVKENVSEKNSRCQIIPLPHTSQK